MNEASSYFQTVYSTPPGLDPYAFAVSDVYQDLFGEGPSPARASTTSMRSSRRRRPHPGEPDPQPRPARRATTPDPGSSPTSRSSSSSRCPTRWRPHAPIGGLAATGNSCRGSCTGDDAASAGSVDGRCSTTFAASDSPISLVVRRSSSACAVPPAALAWSVALVAASFLRPAPAPSCLQSAPSLAERGHGAQPGPVPGQRRSPAGSSRGCWTSRSSVTRPG